MLFKNIPILLAAALAPAPLFATDYEVSPDHPLDLSDIEIDHSSGNISYINNLNITVKNPSETADSTIKRTDASSDSLSIRNSTLSLEKGGLNIINENTKSLKFDDLTFNSSSESSSATVNTSGTIHFFNNVGSLANTNLHIQSRSTSFSYNNQTHNAHFSTITVNEGAMLSLSTNGVYSSANLLIKRSAGGSFSNLLGNNSSQAGFISDSTLSNLNIDDAAITHTSHLTLDNVVLTRSTLTANNLSLVQRNVDASQTLTITTEATITGDLTLDVYLADIDSLGADFSFSADGITGLTDSNLTINFYDSLTNELYATGTDFALNGGVYTSSVEYIPEPSTATLSLFALAGLLARRRRKAA